VRRYDRSADRPKRPSYDVAGEAHGRFTRAVKHRNLLNAEIAAREIGELSLADALTFCLLLADVDPQRFDRAIARWIARFILEAPGITADEAARALCRERVGRSQDSRDRRRDPPATRDWLRADLCGGGTRFERVTPAVASLRSRASPLLLGVRRPYDWLRCCGYFSLSLNPPHPTSNHARRRAGHSRNRGRDRKDPERPSVVEMLNSADKRALALFAPRGLANRTARGRRPNLAGARSDRR